MGSAHINTELDWAESCATSACRAGCLRGLGRLLVTKTPQWTYFGHKRLRPFQKKGRYSQFTTASF